MEEMEHAQEMFVDESLDLLQEMESALNKLKAAPENIEMINLVFRAAHTIKGAAGLFGYDGIVAFTHTVENVLEKVRAGERHCDDTLIAVLLDCRDHIESLIEQLGNQDASSGQELAVQGQALLAQLSGSAGSQQHCGVNNLSSLGQYTEHLPGRDHSNTNRVAFNPYWHFSLRFGEGVLRNGMDPLSFLRYLSSLGDIVELVPLFALPGSSLMDPESCYLGLELQLDSDADQVTLQSVFEFVADESQIHIIPPHSDLQQYVALIKELDQEADELGQLLIQCGALTQEELAYVMEAPQADIIQPAQAMHDPDSDTLLQPQLEPQLQPQSPSQSDVGEPAQQLSPQEVTPKKATAGLPDLKRQESRSLRVDAHKLDQLINLVGELVIAGANTSLLAKQNGDPELRESSAAVSLLVEEIRGLSLHLRMIPIDETFKRFHRVVREISRDLDKDIRLMIEGGETELDKGVVEKINDPLMHLVRNAIDHGIEAKEDRLAKGKPATGTVILRAYYDSGSIVIEVCDDGGGIDPVKVRAKAVENGLISAEQPMSEKEILRLILEAGLTTKTAVSDLSGRGVGMDVVKRNIEALQGSIEVESRLGEGSLLRLRLPLTLSIIDGFAVGVGVSSYVIPLDAVVECIEYSEQHSKNGNYVNLRGEILPFINLRQRFKESHIDVKQRNIVVVQSGEQKAGFVVDQLQGELQTVIKPLSKIFSHLSGISGSTILGSGEVAMILDVPALIRDAETHCAPRYIGHAEVVS
ncbi:chemotaxis protein CheA [Photobacterium alginatilyticum]|uniref:Chemotaxis protein CheA n=1 Tax=Photobacterium alginatilyticum TaxID=1775171 RepID=A0ABW9YH40_9GAMM|nr:chemotaxis protein CheA [Photobacterium alginatilyticum]NBI52750.1 chemotaxis protein CheA [Photobacterium alginatilyticum]